MTPYLRWSRPSCAKNSTARWRAGRPARRTPNAARARTRPLAAHIRRKLVAQRDVEGKPSGIKAADQLVACGPFPKRGMQDAQRIPVV
ncbi:hypothetical protein I553_1791 [Mycobacterium xenopi 4042]|uniref:Uncharacterized protein n=1 Tax=Mycobacterium xenopi 4042 TaxID=1299334 RepID=X8DLK7_MYCXE|nr:hypothetical protein I553_1791 [Mycobacterium xenopi 4042]